MKDDFDNINNKLDKLDEKLGRVDVTLALNTQSLIEHTRRTANLEDRVEPLEKSHMLFVAMAKICIALAGAAGLIELALKLTGKH